MMPYGANCIYRLISIYSPPPPPRNFSWLMDMVSSHEQHIKHYSQGVNCGIMMIKTWSRSGPSS